MKKNLFGLIGSVLGCISVFFLGSPIYVQTSSSETVKVSIAEFMISRNVLFSLLIFFSSLACFIALIHAIIGIVREENTMPVVFSCSSINAFTAMFLISYFNYLEKHSLGSYDYELSWGMVVVLCLYVMFFVWSLSGFILSAVADRKEAKAKHFEKLYEYKKLLDDGIIDRAEYIKLRNQYFE